VCVCACVCVCGWVGYSACVRAWFFVCEREREKDRHIMRERESDRERGRKRGRTKRIFLARDKVEFNERGNRQY
jgi:hypothetical protein